MEVKEFNEAMDTLKGNIVKEATQQVEAVKTELTGKADELKSEFNQFNAKAAEIMKFGRGEREVKTIEDAFALTMKENMDKIKAGRPFEMEVKADMLMSAHLGSGASDAIPTIQNGLVIKPGQALNFTDVVATVQSSTGLYWQYKENVTTGAPAAKTEGALSAQVDYSISKSVNVIPTIAAHSTISSEFHQDASFIQTALPQMLLRDFRRVQNTTFSTALMAAISAATGSATVDVEELIDAIAELEAANFAPNGIVAKPANFARMYKTKDSNGQYTQAPVISVSPAGALGVTGVPAYKMNWSGVTGNNAIVGDWSQAKVVQADGITLRFFDNDFALANKGQFGITISARQALALDYASGFLKVDLLLA